MVAAFWHAAVSPAPGAPAVGRVEGKQPGIEVFEGLVATRAARLGGEQDEFFVGGKELEQALADFKGAGD